MYFITRNKHWLEGLWIFAVLLFFKNYNNFQFKGGMSYAFLILLGIVPFIIELISSYVTNLNKNKYSLRHSSYLKQIEATIDSEFLEPLSKKEKLITDSENLAIYFGEHRMGKIAFSDTHVTISITDTLVEYNFYYSKAVRSNSKYDEYGFEQRPVSYLYQRMMLKINLLTESTLSLTEYKKGLSTVTIILYANNTQAFLYKDKPHRKLNKRKASTKIITL